MGGRKHRKWIGGILAVLGAAGCGGPVEDVVLVGGRILKPDGSPMQGIEVRLHRTQAALPGDHCRYHPNLTASSFEVVSKAMSDPDGRYEFRFHETDIATRTETGSPWCFLIGHPSNERRSTNAGVAFEAVAPVIDVPDLKLWNGHVAATSNPGWVELDWVPPDLQVDELDAEAVFVTETGSAFWSHPVVAAQPPARVPEFALEDVHSPSVHLIAAGVTTGNQTAVHLRHHSMRRQFDGTAVVPVSRGTHCEATGTPAWHCELTDGSYEPVEVLAPSVDLNFEEPLKAFEVVLRSLTTSATRITVYGWTGTSWAPLGAVDEPSAFESIPLRGDAPFAIYRIQATDGSGRPVNINMLSEVSFNM